MHGKNGSYTFFPLHLSFMKPCTKSLKMLLKYSYFTIKKTTSRTKLHQTVSLFVRMLSTHRRWFVSILHEVIKVILRLPSYGPMKWKPKCCVTIWLMMKCTDVYMLFLSNCEDNGDRGFFGGDTKNYASTLTEQEYSVEASGSWSPIIYKTMFQQ